MTRRVGIRYPVFAIVTYCSPKGGEKGWRKQQSRINHKYGKSIYSSTNTTDRLFQTFGKFLKCFLAFLVRRRHAHRSCFSTFATMQYSSTQQSIYFYSELQTITTINTLTRSSTVPCHKNHITKRTIVNSELQTIISINTH